MTAARVVRRPRRDQLAQRVCELLRWGPMTGVALADALDQRPELTYHVLYHLRDQGTIAQAGLRGPWQLADVAPDTDAPINPLDLLGLIEGTLRQHPQGLTSMQVYQRIDAQRGGRMCPYQTPREVRRVLLDHPHRFVVDADSRWCLRSLRPLR